MVVQVSQMENRAAAVKPLQLCNKVGRQMKSHPFGVEEAQTAMAAVQFLGRDSAPILLLVVRTIAGAGPGVFVIVKPLCLLKPDAVAEFYSGECLANHFTK